MLAETNRLHASSAALISTNARIFHTSDYPSSEALFSIS